MKFEEVSINMYRRSSEGVILSVMAGLKMCSGAARSDLTLLRKDVQFRSAFLANSDSNHSAFLKVHCTSSYHVAKTARKNAARLNSHVHKSNSSLYSCQDLQIGDYYFQSLVPNAWMLAW